MSQFALGAYVRKKSGSFWEGIVVGHYSTDQTPDGVAVQLFGWPNGPVQIYPAAALEPCPQAGTMGSRSPKLGASFETVAAAYAQDERAALGIEAAFLAGAKFGAMRAANECLAALPMRQSLETGDAMPGNASETAGAPASPPPSSHVAVEDEIARVVQSVNEWDDRTSPDDYPEHLLITSEELADLLRNFASTLEGK